MIFGAHTQNENLRKASISKASPSQDIKKSNNQSAQISSNKTGAGSRPVGAQRSWVESIHGRHDQNN